LKLKPYETTVTERWAMNYAAAIGDDNPHYFDDERPEGIVAPPMLSAALTWVVSGNIWDYLGGADFPTEVLATQVHYSEHLAWQQPLRPGMRLRIQGEVAAILPHRAGTQIVLRYEAAEIGGEPVFCEHIGGLLRGVRCSDEGRGAQDLPHIPSAPQVGKPGWEAAVLIGRLDSYLYDGCAQIHFPIHISPAFARAVGLPGIILQGTATLAHAARLIVDDQLGGDPRGLKVLACRFGAPVTPGSVIRVRLQAEGAAGGGKELFFEVLNAAGERAVRGGYARVDNR
jgi:acyl dehydratase